MRRRQLLRALALGSLAAACGGRGGDREALPTSSPTAAGRPSPAPGVTVPPSPAPVPTSELRDREAQPSPESATAAAHLEIICREAIGLPPAREDPRQHAIRGLMVHHTAAVSGSAAQAPAQLRGHTALHREQGWPDIAYHYGVDLAGNVYELRDPALPGDTFTDYEPAGWLLVVCEGNFDVTRPTDALLDGVARVLAHGHRTYDAPLETISGHRDHASSACPGDHLYAALDEVRADVARYVAGGGVEAQRVCGEAGRRRVAAIEG